MLYMDDDPKNLPKTCKHCGSRCNPKKRKKQAMKVLRSLKSRLQRLFMCNMIAKQIKWHASESNKVD